jgi:hypothetical protein
MLYMPNGLGYVRLYLPWAMLRDAALDQLARNVEHTLNYYVWYDENAQKTSVEKIRDAMDSYTARFAITANLVLVHFEDKAEMDGIVIRGERNIQRNTFWLGVQETEQREEHNV